MASVTSVKQEQLKWSTENIVKFLNIFKQYECLWDTFNQDYLKRDARDFAMKNLQGHLEAEGFGEISKEQLKNKIKSLKDSYRTELNKIKKSTKSGASPDDIYKPKLGWFSVADSFWKKVVAGRDTQSNLNLNELENTTQEDEMSYNEVATTSTHEVCSTSIMQDSFNPAPNNKRSPNKMTAPTNIRPMKKQKTKQPTRFEKSVAELKSIAQLTATDTDDQFEKFGKHIAAQLREMPLRSFIVLQQEIQGLLTKERLRLCHSDRSIYTPASRPLSSQSSFDDTDVTDYDEESRTSADILQGLLHHF